MSRVMSREKCGGIVKSLHLKSLGRERKNGRTNKIQRVTNFRRGGIREMRRTQKE